MLDIEYPAEGLLMLTAMLHGQKSVEELYQSLSACRKCNLNLLEFDNMADMAYITLGWWAILRQASHMSTLEKPMMSLFSTVSWLRALYAFRGESWMGPRLLPILSALRDTRAFFIVTAVCVLAFLQPHMHTTPWR